MGRLAVSLAVVLAIFLLLWLLLPPENGPRYPYLDPPPAQGAPASHPL